MNLLEILYNFIEYLIIKRNLVYELAKKNFKSKYLGSFLGIIWAFIQPLITILIFWFVFALGFRKGAVNGDCPFLLWLLAGMIPWFFISESINSSVNSISENGYILKKVAFKVSILPVVKIISVLVVHIFFVFVMLMIFWAYGFSFSIYYLQIGYYLLATIILVIGISWITSAIGVFIKDLGQIVNIVIQMGFWMTAIFWPINFIPEKYQIIIKLNPFYYIIEGYRNSLIAHKWFWEIPISRTIYFWGLTCLITVSGIIIFRKLKPYFVDYL
jgi:lipopolysaccharide transport system permease protein/teichoic acid transport system permease protein